jgi:hypothetical protein
MSQANTTTAEKSSDNASDSQEIPGLFVVGSLGFEPRINGDVSRNIPFFLLTHIEAFEEIQYHACKSSNQACTDWHMFMIRL